LIVSAPAAPFAAVMAAISPASVVTVVLMAWAAPGTTATRPPLANTEAAPATFNTL